VGNARAEAAATAPFRSWVSRADISEQVPTPVAEGFALVGQKTLQSGTGSVAGRPFWMA
jgi:hypothetical protein